MQCSGHHVADNDTVLIMIIILEKNPITPPLEQGMLLHSTLCGLLIHPKLPSLSYCATSHSQQLFFAHNNMQSIRHKSTIRFTLEKLT
jgi:hypothetical protein